MPPSPPPTILVTNDDGIHAPGLRVLEKIARTLSDDVWVVAPESEQSGVAHSLTLHQPVRVRKISARRYAVSGTPTDCVLLALKAIIKSPSLKGKEKNIDLVLSGVNPSSNAGDDITYSGTVAAAMEGTNLGVPSIALSQHSSDRGKIQWATAQRHAPALIRQLIKIGWQQNTLININFPDCVPDRVKGVRACAHGKRLVNVALTERIDPKGRPYFWLGGDRENTADRPGVDLDLMEKGYITVTPVGMDLTDYAGLAALKKLKQS